MEVFLFTLVILIAGVCGWRIRNQAQCLKGAAKELQRYRSLANIMADAHHENNARLFAHAACHIIRMTGRWNDQESRP